MHFRVTFFKILFLCFVQSDSDDWETLADDWENAADAAADETEKVADVTQQLLPQPVLELNSDQPGDTSSWIEEALVVDSDLEEEDATQVGAVDLESSLVSVSYVVLDREEKNADQERKDAGESSDDFDDETESEDEVPVTYLSKLVSSRRLITEQEMFKALGGDACIIDGDSLLGYLLFSVSILEFGQAGQLLQLVYHAEQLLKRFCDQGGPMRVLFIEEHARGWQGVHLVAREVLRLHIHSLGLPVDDLPRCEGPEWDAYLDLQRPGYMMARMHWPSPGSSTRAGLSATTIVQLTQVCSHFCWQACAHDFCFYPNLAHTVCILSV